MSQYQNDVKDAIKSGLNLNDSMFKEEFYMGRFISGWKQPKTTTNPRVGHRKVDIKINGANTIYRISREILIEADGTQHDNPNSTWNDPEYDKDGNLIWSRSQKFNDQIDRDQWVNIKAEESNRILLRIKEPEWKDTNPAYFDQRHQLMEKLKSPGYLYSILKDCEDRRYKGMIITWDGEKPVTPKRNWPKHKYI